MRKTINTVYKCKTRSTKSEVSGICSSVKEKEVLKGQNLGRHAKMAMFSRNFHSSESAELENCLRQIWQHYKINNHWKSLSPTLRLQRGTCVRSSIMADL